MGCTSCSNGGGLPKGCRGNGSCGTSGCDSLTVFDWLSDMEAPAGQQPFDWVEIRFKNGRKEFYKNVDGLSLHMGDIVAVETQPGHDIGQVSLTGELVRLQMRKKKFRLQNDQAPKVYRKATQKDIDIWTEAQGKEHETMLKAREISARLNLVMKISDVEFQGDGSKATFYYTADDRVDFRQLIRELASMFRVRIEMRQIGARQEASRLGGIGSCGRELCCSTWLTDFRSVNTSAARYQQLSLNPTKLAGQCGKLKCCLNYELDSYVEALKSFPDTGKRLKTGKGEAMYMKMDIFKGMMWYAYVEEAMTWIALDTSTVSEIQAKNAKGEIPASLEELMQDIEVEEPDYDNVVGQDDINRFDRQRKTKSRRKKPKAKTNTAKPAAKATDAKPVGDNKGSNKPTGNKQGGQNKPGGAGNKPKPKGRRPQNKRKPNTTEGGGASANKPQSANTGQAPKAEKGAPRSGGKRPNNRRKPRGPKGNNNSKPKGGDA